MNKEIQKDQKVETESWFGSLTERLLHGDIGSLPVLLGLILIAVVFQIANPNFLTPLNLTNLLVQIAAVGTIAVGVVLVLLIGEIDLSIGSVSGLTASIMAVVSVKMGLPGWMAILAGILSGALIGLLHGWWVAKLHVPSFVVTLAGFLGWQGAQLYVLGNTGTINLADPLILGISNSRLPVIAGWIIGALFIAGFAFSLLRERSQRARKGLPNQMTPLAIGRIVLIALVILAVVGLMSVDRNPSRTVPIMGVPSAVIFLTAFVVVFSYIIRRTKFGRFVFAVGGNAEAARRAGINVDRIKIVVFILSSTLAACGGILAGSRLYAVNQSSGGGDMLLNAIAAAVIGGTSLFGGRGSVWSALLGALVIGSIANGMDLLALASSIRFMVTGAVLLIAVTLDAYTRARREQTGSS
ncbi:MAG: sugar ABC transporter permease [Anaerolineales bacterium]